MALNCVEKSFFFLNGRICIFCYARKKRNIMKHKNIHGYIYVYNFYECLHIHIIKINVVLSCRKRREITQDFP